MKDLELPLITEEEYPELYALTMEALEDIEDGRCERLP